MSKEGEDLFGAVPAEASQAAPVRASAAPRVDRPNRLQVELRPSDLESLLAQDHQARVVWGYVERQNLSGLYARIKVVEGGAGRSAIAPEILLSLWLYATLDGVGSARALARLCEAHDAYRWICGGVRVNHHTLSDFRMDHEQFLDGLLTANVAALLASGAVRMQRVAQDGMRVRAHAGAAGFRRKERLQLLHEQAKAQVNALKRELADDPDASNRRQKAARERAVREREQRIEAALKALPQVERIKQARGKPADSARVSTTDAEASVMKMPDGGFRPAFNAQLATDTQTQVIVGVDVVATGSEHGQMPAMLDQLHERYGQRPQEMLVDGGYSKLEDIEQAAAVDTKVFAPVRPPRGEDRDRHEPRAGDSPAIADWRQRMGTEEGKTIYKERAATAECVHAIARNRGLTRFNVRGLKKTRTVLLWFVLAHNLAKVMAFALASSFAAT
jgi:transposase